MSGTVSLRSPKKSVLHASRELEMSTMTVWRVLRKRLEIKPYRLHLLQFLQSFWYAVYNCVKDVYCLLLCHLEIYPCIYLYTDLKLV
jgi:hypothetical protein